MKINLAKSSGFCFGVKRAIDIALKTAASEDKVCMLGDIVHNEDVIKEIKKAGIKKIKKLAPGKNKVLLICAHGAGIATLKKAGILGYKIIDATCPMVKEIHKIASSREQKGYKIIVIGDRKHDEVRGIIGQLKNKAIVIDPASIRSHISLQPIKKTEKAAIVVQSTQNLGEVIKIVEALKPHINQLRFFNTICRPTRMKQDEIKAMSLENDAMIIIGSKTSANTKRLYEISKSLNQRSYWIQSKKEIENNWFKHARCVGVTAGASTPESTIKDVVEHINRIAQGLNQ